MKTSTCKNCGKQFVPATEFEGKKIWRYTRPFCFECVPYTPSRLGVSRTKTKNTADGKRQCKMCGVFKPAEEFPINSKLGYRDSYCGCCRNKKHGRRRQQFKKECIAYKGGKCQICGYDKCPASLEFHHRDPNEKEFSLREVHVFHLIDKIKEELDKCDLLCANCHNEQHYNEIL